MELQLVQTPLAGLVYQKDLILLLVTFGGMLFVMLLEQCWPRRSQDTAPALRWLFNWGLATCNFFAMIFLAIYLGGWLAVHAPGPLLPLFEYLPAVPAVALVFILIEGIAYGIHRLFHRIPALWYLHSVHHSDCAVDATTSHRHHLGEVFLSSMLLLPVPLLLGVPPGYVVLVALLRLSLTIFNHGNLAIPSGVDRALRPLVVTPDFHRVHHARDRTLADSNFGIAVPWFDYLFGTARTIPPDAQVRVPLGVGIEEEDAPFPATL